MDLTTEGDFVCFEIERRLQWGEIIGQERKWGRREAWATLSEALSLCSSFVSQPLLHTLAMIVEMKPSTTEQAGCQNMKSQVLDLIKSNTEFENQILYKSVKYKTRCRPVHYRSSIERILSFPAYGIGRCAANHLNAHSFH